MLLPAAKSQSGQEQSMKTVGFWEVFPL